MFGMTASEARAQQKKNLIALILCVAVLDGVMIALYYAFDVRDGTVKTQQTFVGIWVVLTLIIVTTILRRIRQARRRR